MFLSQDGSPCSRDHFVHAVRHALSKAGLNPLLYAGHAASELELPQPPLLQAFQPTRSRGWAAQGHQMLTCCTSVNLIALYYISLLSSPLHQAANMQAFSPFPSERHYLYFHFHTFYTIFITFPTTSMGSYHPSPLHSSNSTLITVTSCNPFKNLKHFCKLKHHFPFGVLWANATSLSVVG